MKEAGTEVYLSLGGNVGPVLQAFRAALASLENHPAVRGLRTSRLYRTAPWGKTDQPDFLNLVVGFSWTRTVEEMADLIEELESAARRDRKGEERWGPRTLDIDLLLWGDLQCKSPLTIPHPRMHQRRFVLAPLAELAGELTPPGWKVTLSRQGEITEDRGEVEPISTSSWTGEEVD